MKKRGTSWCDSETPMASEPRFDLEAQLESVVEQDGMTMLAADGMRRHLSVRTERKVKAIYKSSLPAFESPRPLLDPVSEWDAAILDLPVAMPDGGKERPVAISFVVHPRSPYVISLRQVTLRDDIPARDERTPVAIALGSAHAPMVQRQDPAVYGTLSQDLCVSSYDPFALRDQFTPDFQPQAFCRSWRLERVREALRVFGQEAIGLLQRVERVERRLGQEVEQTLTVDTPRFSFVRALAGFAALLFVVTLPANAVGLYRSASKTRDQAEGLGQAALIDLKSAKAAETLGSSIKALKNASARFREADAILTDSRALALSVASVMPTKYRSARALLEVGDKASEAGRLLALGFDKVFSDKNRRLDERLEVLSVYARGVMPLIKDARQASAAIDPGVLPEGQRAQLTDLQTRLDQAEVAIAQWADLADALALMAGKNRPRTYLLVFQNDTELRPTGGFMGSVAEVVMDQGRLKKIRVPPGGTYDLKGQLTVRVQSPEPLRLINPLWQFQDANWSPDFPTSAAKMRWFWSKAGQPTLDGVIAVNASFIQQLLAVTGPVDMPGYGKTISAENFFFGNPESRGT